MQTQLAARNAAFEKQTEQLRSQIKAKEEEQRKVLAAKEAEFEKQKTVLQGLIKAKEAECEKKLAEARQSAETEAERLRRRSEAEAADLKATISRLEVDLVKVKILHSMSILDTTNCRCHRATRQRRRSYRLCGIPMKRSWPRRKRITKRLWLRGPRALKMRKTNARGSRKNCRKLTRIRTGSVPGSRRYGPAPLLNSRVGCGRLTTYSNKQIEAERTEAVKAKDATQSELDDLLMVFGDLEEKVAKYKV